MEETRIKDSRNYLARLRTQMANERTLMSYYRSALALIGLGAFVFKFYENMVFYVVAGLFVLLGIILGIYGMTRYYRFKSKLLRR